MIKLAELLKELNIDELELRSGQLEVDDNKTYFTFLEDFRIPEDEFFDWDQVNNNKFNSKLLKKSVIVEDGPYQFIAPSTYTGTLYIVNSEGKTLPDYVIGTVDVDVINLSVKDGKPFKITGAAIHLTYVTTPWRGKGLGVKMYTMLLEAYGSVFSDNILYEGSLSMWTKKLAAIGNEPGNFFGIQVGKIIVPLSVEDASDSFVIKDIGVDHFIVSVRPPQVLSDIKAALVGLSLAKGQYGVYEADQGLTAAKLQTVIDEGVGSLDELISQLDLYQVVGVEDNYSTIVAALDNAMVILREEGDEVVMDII